MFATASSKGKGIYQYYLVDKSGTVTVELGSTATLHPDAPPEIIEMFDRGLFTFCVRSVQG